MAVPSRSAIVTGGGGGLGLAVAELLLGQGMSVSIADVDPERLADASAHLGGPIHAIGADLSRTADCDRVVAEATARWGHVDVLVNCAAILHRVDLYEIDEETFEHVINTNLRSVFWLCRGVIPGMDQRGYGRIVNITSIGVHTGGYNLSSAIYESTKGAIGNFTKTLSRSLAPKGILVNSVAPGAMRTRMLVDQTPADVLALVEADIPLGRMADPAEVAGAVAFLASEQNTYATGATFDVNGGAAMP